MAKKTKETKKPKTAAKITPLKKVMLPFLNHNAYPKASDGLHFGKEYCKEYARTLKNFLIENNIEV